MISKLLVRAGAIVSLLAMACSAPAAPATPAAPAAPPTAVPEQRAEQQVLRIGVNSILANPTPQATFSNIYQFFPLYDPLTQFGPEFEVRPSVAEKWELLPDGTTWRFTVRKDMTWPGGEKLTAADVAFSMNEAISKNWPARTFLATVTEAKANDDVTVDFLTSKADMSIPNGAPYLWIVPKKYYEAAGGFNAFALKPVGSGPYELVDFRNGDLMQFKLRKEPHAFRKPVATEILFKVIPENGQQVTGLRTDELDISAQVPFSADQTEQLKQAGATIIANRVSVTTLGIPQGTFESKNTPLKDKRVRLAVNYAVDKAAIAKTIYGGFAEPVGQQAIPGSLYWDPSVQPIPFDPSRAKQLLTEAGYPNGFKLENGIDFAVSVARPDVMLAIQGYLRDVGIQVELNQVESGVYLDKALGRNNQKKGDFAAGQTTDNNGFMSQVRQTAGCGKPAGSPADAVWFCDPEWDRLLDAANAERDPKKRSDLMRAANKVHRDDVAVLYLLLQPTFVVHTAKIRGVQLALPLYYSLDTAYKVK